MKQFILICLLLLLISTIALAQLSELRIVGTPTKLTTEITGVRDANGRFCAAIQVISDMEGFSYQSNNGVVRMDDDPGKDMVFLQPDERRLEIYHSGYKPLEIIFSEIGVQLRSKEVWKIEIAGDAEKIPVTILTTPENAIRIIDDNNQGTKIQHLLSIGEHRVRLEKDDYASVDTTIQIDTQNALFQFNLREKVEVLIQISSTPDEAQVYLNDVPLGKTPVSEYVMEDKYTLKIEKKGYISYYEELDIKPPQIIRSVELETMAAWLTIKTAPNAVVKLDGKPITTLENIRLEPSLVTVQAIVPKAKPVQKRVMLEAGARKTVELFPEVPTANLRVAVTPFDASIELTGDLEEHFTANGSKEFENIPAGEYTVKVSSDGHKTETEKISLKKGDNKKLSVKLAPPSKGSKKWLWYTAGTVVVGGGVAAAILLKKDDPKTTEESILPDPPTGP